MRPLELAGEEWSVSDIIEVFRPESAGRICSSIDMAWKGRTRGKLDCHIESIYIFKHDMHLENFQCRFVAINTEHHPNVYLQHERNVVFEPRGITGQPKNILVEDVKVDGEVVKKGKLQYLSFGSMPAIDICIA